MLNAAENGNLDEIKRLLIKDRHLLQCTDKDGYTPLHRACYGNHMEVVEVCTRPSTNATRYRIVRSNEIVLFTVFTTSRCKNRCQDSGRVATVTFRLLLEQRRMCSSVNCKRRRCKRQKQGRSNTFAPSVREFS